MCYKLPAIAVLPAPGAGGTLRVRSPPATGVPSTPFNEAEGYGMARDEQLGRPHSYRFSLDEIAALDMEAERQFGAKRKRAQLVRRYVREGLMRDQGGEAPPRHDQLRALGDALDSCRLELSRIGGNLNQVAHAVNLHDVVDGRSLAACHDELRTQFQQLASLLRQVLSLLKEVRGSGLLYRRNRQE